MGQEYIQSLPGWAQQLATKYYSKTVSQFLIHGNVRDLVPMKKNGALGYVPLRQFLAEALFGGRDLVIFYDRGGGIAFAQRDMQLDFQRALGGYDSFHGTNYARSLPRNADSVLALLESYVRLRLNEGKRLALVIDYAETIAPAGEISFMSTEDRNSLVILKRWSHDTLFLQSDITVCLITENLTELSNSLVQSPYAERIEIPLPNENERLEFIRHQITGKPFAENSDIVPETLAKLTAGFKRIQLQNILGDAFENKRRMTHDVLLKHKRALIEAECYNLLEFVESPYNLNTVAGHEAAKQKLKDAAQAIRMGKLDVLPMGYLICGPVGTGKTFLSACFAGEIGIPCVKLKNFRSQWQGVTEGNLEKILNLLKALCPVAVIIDEADAYLGNRESSGDSGVSNRVFAQIAGFMGNTEYRGKIIWFLVTCRPDLMPVDLKRQGRAEEHVALFYPETAQEKEALFEAMQKKTRTKVENVSLDEILPHEKGALSGADIEAALVRAKFRSAIQGNAAVVREDLKQVFDDFIPASYPLEIELQSLAAALECTSRSLLPERFRQMRQEDMIRRINELKSLLGESM
jgi:SpoVK/Ycf46/Vps4 family AAA+-type ATPase